ncbi:MAG TPA: hypothetical protein VLT33_35050 [Labilithrix sp.]|nr:hypothetical protein [Labilithrix sp.]
MTPRRAHALGLQAALVALVALVAPGCAATPDDGSIPSLAVTGLDRAGYEALVQPVVERRCGSLDCHGKLPRGLRVYGQNSLRLPNDAGLAVGSGKTSTAEAEATYASIVGLEPEKTRAFAEASPRTVEGAYALTFLSKPLERERHRGGASLRKDEPAEQCLRTWLVGPINQTACAEALARP